MNLKQAIRLFCAVIIGTSFASSAKLYGQTTVSAAEKSTIEVIGSAEMEVVPNEIYISIILRERYENKQKVSIEEQEEKLKSALKELGIDLKNLYLSDANADYIKVRWGTKDVLTKKDYTLKVSSAATLSNVFQQLSKLEIRDASIARVSHSGLDSLKKEVQILAIRAAKNKADYLLAAIGEKTGKPLSVQERENSYMPVEGVGYGAGNGAGYAAGVFVDSNAEPDEELQFSKIKVEAYIYVRFAIE